MHMLGFDESVLSLYSRCGADLPWLSWELWPAVFFWTSLSLKSETMHHQELAGLVVVGLTLRG
jgi:hypothetical protein